MDPRTRTSALPGLCALLALGIACSTVEDGSGDPPPNMAEGQRDCMIFPGAQAWDEEAQAWRDLELVEFPEYCWCEASDDALSPELLDQLKENALAECIWTALYLGYDPTQTNCIEVMLGPVEGGFDGDTSCTLYGGEDYSVIGDGETGGEETGETETGGDGVGDEAPSTPYLSAYRPVTDVNASTIDWSGGGTPSFAPLSCDLNTDCCELFAADICAYTDPRYPMSGARADWSVGDSRTSIDIIYQGCPVTPGPELVVEGRADYSLAACEDARCPVYLAALELELPTGQAGSFSTALFDGHCADKTIERFDLELVHAGLGSYDPLDGRIAFGVGSLVFETEVDVSAQPGEFGAGEYSFLAYNDREVWGWVDEEGTLSFEPGSLSFEALGFELGVAFEAEVLGAPPQVEVERPEVVECEGAGEVTLAPWGWASDPDGDLLRAYWTLDDAVVVEETVRLPEGAHELSFRAVDARGASAVRHATVQAQEPGPGRYELLWSTVDTEGNAVVETQLLSCRP